MDIYNPILQAAIDNYRFPPPPAAVRAIREHFYPDRSVREARAECAAFVRKTARAWRSWEDDPAVTRHARPMPAELWEFFLIRVGLHPIYRAGDRDDQNL